MRDCVPLGVSGNGKSRSMWKQDAVETVGNCLEALKRAAFLGSKHTSRPSLS